jgi:hypothetical protein
MNILFTFEEQACLERSFYLINWFIYNGHTVDVYYDGEVLGFMKSRCLATIYKKISNYSTYDIWLYSLKCDTNVNIPTLFLDELDKFQGKMYMLAMDDTIEFFTYKINLNILNKTLLFLGNVWYKDKNTYDGVYDPKLGWVKQLPHKFKVIPSFQESSNFEELDSIKEIPFRNKCRQITFTGGMNGMLPGQDIRLCTLIKVCRFKDVIPSQIKITGFTADPVNTYYYNTHIPDIFKHKRLSFNEYISELNNNKFSLCPKGNSPHITYRLYESLRYKSLVFMNKISSEIEFYNPPQPNKDYVEYDIDCSNLLDLLRYYDSHLEEAEQIVENGYKYWKHFQFHKDGSISYELDKYLKQLLEL